MIADTLRGELADLNKFLLDCDQQVEVVRALYPSNAVEERTKFLTAWAAGVCQNPHFDYSPLKSDPVELYETVQELTLEQRVREKGHVFAPLDSFARHLRSSLRIIMARATPQLTTASLEAYGRPSTDLVAHATTILADTRTLTSPTPLDSLAVITRLTEALVQYNLSDWQIVGRDASATRLAVDPAQQTIYVRKDSSFSHNEVERLLVHEVETHVLRSENGRRQPVYPVLAIGLHNYLATEEGLAAYNESRAGYRDDEVMRTYALRVLAVDCALKADFCETFALLNDSLTPTAAFDMTLRVKRGLADMNSPGSFTKDYVYLAGVVAVEAFAAQNGDVASLYVGKVGLSDLSALDELQNEGLVVPPLHTPHFYQDRAAQ